MAYLKNTSAPPSYSSSEKPGREVIVELDTVAILVTEVPAGRHEGFEADGLR
jgi:hypothetical protein